MYFCDKTGNGYNGYSMSNNAVDAYENGERPLSKWTKTAIVEAVAEINPSAADLIKSVPAAILKQRVLIYTAWHHTSARYNTTDFYAVDEDVISELTAETVAEWKAEKTVKTPDKIYRGEINYIEWIGTGRHPKAVKKCLADVNITERGSFYYVTDVNGNELLKKKIDSNGTSVINYEERDERIRREEEIKNAYRTNSSPSALAFLDGLIGKERSRSGHIYPYGKKPSAYNYEIGLDKFFVPGDRRIFDDIENKKYVLETWDGEKWITE